MEVHLLGHTAVKNAEGICYGQADVELSDTFEQDANNIKLDRDYDLIVCRPASRCTQLANFLNLSYREEDRLKEINFGDWELRAWNKIDQAALAVWMEDFINIAPPNGENLLEMNDRVIGFLNEIRTDYQKVLLITHAGVIRIIMSHLTGLSLNDMFSIKVQYGDLIKVNM